MEDRLIDVIVELLARSVHEGYHKLIDKGFPNLSVILKLNAVIVWPFIIGFFLLERELNGKILKPFATDVEDCRFEVEQSYVEKFKGYRYYLHFKPVEKPTSIPMPSKKDIVDSITTTRYETVEFRYRAGLDYLLVVYKDYEGKCIIKEVYDSHGLVKQGIKAFALSHPTQVSFWVFFIALLITNIFIIIILWIRNINSSPKRRMKQ